MNEQSLKKAISKGSMGKESGMIRQEGEKKGGNAIFAEVVGGQTF